MTTWNEPLFAPCSVDWSKDEDKHGKNYLAERTPFKYLPSDRQITKSCPPKQKCRNGYNIHILAIQCKKNHNCRISPLYMHPPSELNVTKSLLRSQERRHPRARTRGVTAG
jgi:hypothetical protein